METIASPYYEYKLALNVNSSTFGLVKQNGFKLIFQVKSMPMQHMLTLHMFVRSPHTSPCRNVQRLQRWDDEHGVTNKINTTDEEDSIVSHHVVVCSSACHIVYLVFTTRGCVHRRGTFLK